MDRKRVCIVTPTFFGHGTGAANHYGLFARWLLDRGHDVLVISEAVAPSWQRERLSYWGALPVRTSRNRQSMTAYVAYLRETMALPRILKAIPDLNPDVVFLHSAICSRPSVTQRVIAKLRRRTSATIVLDVRDTLSRAAIRRASPHSDIVTACGLAVSNQLSQEDVPSDQVVAFGVAQEPVAVDEASIIETRERFGLHHPYVVYSGMLKPSKRVDLLCEAFAVVQAMRPGIELDLVLVGHIKSASRTFNRKLRAKRIRVIPAQNRDTVLRLVGGAALHINPSTNESFGRSSLEAIALGVPCLLPPGVPEFAVLGSRYVCGSSADVIATQILDLHDSPKPVPYDVTVHAPETVYEHLGRRLDL